MNSGKSLTQLGLFEDCVSLEEMKYGLLEMMNKTTNAPVGIQMGFCLPKECSKEEVEQFSTYVLNVMKFPYGSRYTENPQNFTTDFGATFYITAVLLSLFVVLVIVSSFSKKLSAKSAIVGAFNLQANMSIFAYK
jgi:hypothetical protein